MINFKIEMCSSSDVAEILRLEKESFSLPWSERALLDQLNTGNFICFVAKEENISEKGELLGYVGAYYVLDEGYITNLAVWPKVWDHGIGGALINRLLETGVQHKLRFFTLEVRVSNLRAIKLYESCGFEQQGMRKNFYSNPNEDAILMTRFQKRPKESLC